MLLNTYPKLIEKILCRCGVIQDLQKILNNPTRDSTRVDLSDVSDFTHPVTNSLYSKSDKAERK